MTAQSSPRRGAVRLAAAVLTVAVAAVLVAVFASRGMRPKPASQGGAGDAPGEVLRVGALPVT